MLLEELIKNPVDVPMKKPVYLRKWIYTYPQKSALQGAFVVGD